MESHSLLFRRTIRPTRLAFVVPVGDPTYMRRVLELNTCLWGGKYNGLIPFAAGRPRWLAQGAGKRHSVRQMMQGYVRAFEPDYVIVPDEPIAKWSDDSAPALAIDALTAGTPRSRLKHGIDSSEIYQVLY